LNYKSEGKEADYRDAYKERDNEFEQQYNNINSQLDATKIILLITTIS